MWKTKICVIVILLKATMMFSGHAQTVTQELPDRMSEVDEDDLILLNVAAKGRVVELLANELARTEIIRALLVEYARECARNVSVLETHCIDCMMDRCSNRLLECGIELPPLAEVISHQRSPIKGLQFLSKPPQEVVSHLDRFVKIARPDILEGVPKNLEKQAKKIVEEEVDQSLRDLTDNRDTDTALKHIHMHDNTKGGTVTKETTKNGVVFVISHVDHGESVADILGRRLRKSRPLLERLGEHSARVMENMPEIMGHVNTQLEDFRQVVGNIFGGILDNFQESMSQPNTAVVNSNGQSIQQSFKSPNNFPQGPVPQNPRFIQGQISQGQQFNNQQFGGQPQFPQSQMLNNDGLSPNQMLQMSNVPIQPLPPVAQPGSQPNFRPQQNGVPPNPVMQDMIGIQPRPTPNQGQMFQGQGQNPMNQGQSFQTAQPAMSQGQWQMQGQDFQNQPQGSNFQGNFQGQTFQGQNFQGQNMNGQNGQFQGQTFQGQSQPQNFQPPQNTQGQTQGQIQPQNFQRQPQGSTFNVQQSQGRRKRDLVKCDSLKRDPETYCRKFEADCYNCTLEKRLRFEVCGDGVERARDEIKRLDTSVDEYLESYDNHIANTRLILKIELNDRNRLHKTNSYNDAYITAKIGPSILRFQSKMILNINNIRVSGSQLGDELWERLWQQDVLKEAERVEIPGKGNDVMGQTHGIHKVSSSKNSARQTGGGSTIAVSMLTFTFSIAASVFVYFV